MVTKSRPLLTVSHASCTFLNPRFGSFVYSLAMRQANHYYLFGVVLKERAWHRVTNQSGQVSYVNGDGGYRYNGINGQETDSELGAGVSTAEFWQYDAKLGKRWNTDPVNKPWFSPYSTFSNSPISRIDPKGDDDYFDKNGKFLFSTSEGHNIFITTSDKTVLDKKNYMELIRATSKPLEDAVASVNENGKNKTMINILKHYESQLPEVISEKQKKCNYGGMEEDNNSVGSSHLDGTIYLSVVTLSYGYTDGKVWVKYGFNDDVYDEDKKMNVGEFPIDNYNNLKNWMVHERYHSIFQKDIPIDGKTYQSYVNHLDAYYAQITHSTFANVTKEYREHVINNIKDYLEYYDNADKKVEAIKKFESALGEKLYEK